MMSKSSARKTKIWNITKRYLYMFALTMKWIIILIVLGALLVGGVAFGYASALVSDEPLRSREEMLQKMQETSVSGFIYFNDDSLIGQIRSDEDRTLIPIKDIPQFVQNAFLAIEDDDFNKHLGVDVSGFLRAVKEQLLNEPRQTGGSTITQQVTKLTFLTNEVTRERKAKEILLALRLERYMSKNEILEVYLNKIPFGNGSNGYYTYGIKTAAKGIFDVDNLEKLNHAQAAYLAGLPQNPNQYSAFDANGNFNESGFKRAMDRQRLVLYRMLEEEVISQKEYDEARAFDIKASLAPTKKKAYTTYPFLMLEAERKAAEAIILSSNPQLTVNDLRSEEYADEVQRAREQLRGGYKIYTTIDKDIYDAMQEIAKNPENFTPDHEEKGVEQLGVIMLENKTGAILGMIEGRDFYVEQLNHATQMIRQPGSAMKTIAAYLPAIEQGKIQPASAIDDIPMLLPDWVKGYHIPNNHNFRYHGLITARHALNQSYNIPALRIFNDIIGIDAAWEFSKKLGITTITENDYHATTGVIGGMEYGTSVEELTNAYAAVANQGKFNDAYMIRRIENANGDIIYEHEPNDIEVFSEETAYIATDMMRTVISSGTAGRIRSTFKHYNSVPVAGKTGTTQNDHDIWFIGYSPDVTVGVWTGYDTPSPLMRSLGAQDRAKDIWSLVMDTAIEVKPELFETPEFTKPDNIVSMTVSRVSGKLPSELARQANLLVTDIFNKKFIPEEEDDVLSVMKVISYNGINYIPRISTPEDMITEKIVVHRPVPMSEYINQIKEILDEMPTQHRPKTSGGALRPIEYYYPPDLHMAAPSEADPREDDGLPPSPPSGLVLSKLDDNTVQISFQNSPEEDVVGYRLYRSWDNRPFVHATSQNVLVGEQFIKDGISSQYVHAYFLTAVDVAGNESAPSQIVSTGGQLDQIPQMPDFSQSDDENEDELNEQEPQPEGNHGGSNANDSGPNDSSNENASGNNGANDQADTGNESPSSDSGGGENDRPSPPQGLTFSSSGLVSIVLQWEPNHVSQNINRYYVYYSDEQDGNYRRIGSSNTSQFEVVLPSEGWYRVMAENNRGFSSPSQAIQYAP